MAVGFITKEAMDKSYEAISAYEKQSGLGKQALSQLGLLFFVSQAEEVTSVADFFSGRNLPISECFEDFNASYELIKMGLNKQAFIALRVAVDNGLMAAYWKARGDRTKEFRRWLRSADPTPQKTRAFWEALNGVPTVGAFFAKFPVRQDIATLDDLGNYVHTRGVAYSTTADFQVKARVASPHPQFDRWWTAFKSSVRIVLILQLLVNPKLSIDISDDALLAKFGTYNKMPFMGILFGGHADQIRDIVGIPEYADITRLAANTHEVKSILAYLQSLPDLTPAAIRAMIVEEQKNNILGVGLDKWLVNPRLYDYRIDQEMVAELQTWFATSREKGTGCA